MAPPQRYPSPAKQLLELGRRARAEGLAFDEFWNRAVRPGQPPLSSRTPAVRTGEISDAVVWPSDTADRAAEQAAAEAMREAWRRAYEEEPPTKGEQAIMRLYGITAETDTGGMEAGSGVPLATSL